MPIDNEDDGVVPKILQRQNVYEIAQVTYFQPCLMRSLIDLRVSYPADNSSTEAYQDE